MSSIGTGVGQLCAFCSTGDVVWAHALAEDLVAYHEYGKGHTLPMSWALCDRCEAIYASGDDDAAVEVMRSSGWSSVADEDVAECVRQTLDALWRWVERDDLPRPRPTIEHDPLILEFFTWTEPEAIAFADRDPES